MKHTIDGWPILGNEGQHDADNASDVMAECISIKEDIYELGQKLKKRFQQAKYRQRRYDGSYGKEIDTNNVITDFIETVDEMADDVLHHWWSEAVDQGGMCGYTTIRNSIPSCEMVGTAIEQRRQGAEEARQKIKARLLVANQGARTPGIQTLQAQGAL